MRLSSLIFLGFSLAACGTHTQLGSGLPANTESEASESEQTAPDRSDEPDAFDDSSGSDPNDDNEDAAETNETDTDASTNTNDGNTNTAGSSNGPILVLGDSIMAWNVEEGTSIGHVIQERTEQPVTIRAVSGAHFASEEDEDIRSQYVEGDWSWVVFTGGGNDLNDRCSCGDCSGVLNELLSADGSTGAVAEAVDALSGTGTKVLFLTYYDLPTTAQFGFANCGDESQALDERGAAMAAMRDNVFWLDMGEVVFPTDLSAFDDDHVHPSERGSALIGELVAERIMAQ